ncbi:MAG: glycosyltransferase, partial [Thermodesulfovibrionales bacterium]|nr:glycosyltransferase [Thermodesulfovibrionales bacterium]
MAYPYQGTPRKMTEKPLVTIITVTLNAEKYLRETLESVACQDYPNIEYLIVDGGSTDSTFEILG